MLIALGLATVWANMPLPEVQAVAGEPVVIRRERTCIALTRLPPSPDVQFAWTPGVAPADLPGPRFSLPKTVIVELAEGARLFGPDADVYVGSALVDTETGAVTVNGTDFSRLVVDCR